MPKRESRWRQSPRSTWKLALKRISAHQLPYGQIQDCRRHAASAASLPVSGSKNSALPALAACLLTDEPVTLHRIPQVKDIATMESCWNIRARIVDATERQRRFRRKTLDRPEAPYEVVKTMRASSLVLGPLVARTGRARVSMPGGCAIGARPINLHVPALEQLGATIEQSLRLCGSAGSEWACVAVPFTSIALPSPALKTF